MNTGAFQPWLVDTLMSVKIFQPFMHTRWGWPAAESVHFLGLSMLIGAIGTFDLRLAGMAKRIPLGALHRLVPWGVAGYGLNVITGFMFLTTEANQYIYNPSFHFKMLFMGVAGLNVLVFYSALFRKIRDLGPGADAPLAARIIGGVSLCCWIGIIVCGRLLTFYRPALCGTEAQAFPFFCIP
jgi:hypothetical protein